MWITCIVLFVFGGILGTFGDLSHVVTLTNGYQDPIAPIPGTGQPFWVPLLFGSACVALGIHHKWTDRWFHINNKKVSSNLKTHIRANVLFLMLYGSSGALFILKTGALRDAFIATGAISLWYFFDRTWKGLVTASIASFLGTSIEIFLVHIQAFFYYPADANLFGVPSWLPWLYIAAAISVGNMGRYLLNVFGGSPSQAFTIPLRKVC